MPPFSPGANGFTPNSMKLFWPSRPCQPCVDPQTCGGSMRPVDRGAEHVVTLVVASVVQVASLLAGPAVTDLPVQSAVAQYTAPGTRTLSATETRSNVFARLAPMVELPQGEVPEHDADPSAGPPAS